MLYFLGAALVVASIFLMLDTQQSRRLNSMAKETKKVEPLFLLRSAEHKLLVLNALLYGAANNNGSPVKLNGDTRQMLSAKLSRLVNERSEGAISLKAYYSELNELLKKAGQVN